MSNGVQISMDDILAAESGSVRNSVTELVSIRGRLHDELAKIPGQRSLPQPAAREYAEVRRLLGQSIGEIDTLLNDIRRTASNNPGSLLEAARRYGITHELLVHNINTIKTRFGGSIPLINVEKVVKDYEQAFFKRIMLLSRLDIQEIRRLFDCATNDNIGTKPASPALCLLTNIENDSRRTIDVFIEGSRRQVPRAVVLNEKEAKIIGQPLLRILLERDLDHYLLTLGDERLLRTRTTIVNQNKIPIVLEEYLKNKKINRTTLMLTLQRATRHRMNEVNVALLRNQLQLTPAEIENINNKLFSSMSAARKEKWFEKAILEGRGCEAMRRFWTSRIRIVETEFRLPQGTLQNIFNLFLESENITQIARLQGIELPERTSLGNRLEKLLETVRRVVEETMSTYFHGEKSALNQIKNAGARLGFVSLLIAGGELGGRKIGDDEQIGKEYLSAYSTSISIARNLTAGLGWGLGIGALLGRNPSTTAGSFLSEIRGKMPRTVNVGRIMSVPVAVGLGRTALGVVTDGLKTGPKIIKKVEDEQKEKKAKEKEKARKKTEEEKTSSAAPPPVETTKKVSEEELKAVDQEKEISCAIKLNSIFGNFQKKRNESNEKIEKIRLTVIYKAMDDKLKELQGVSETRENQYKAILKFLDDAVATGIETPDPNDPTKIIVYKLGLEEKNEILAEAKPTDLQNNNLE